jgi:hypothetical protein
MKWGVVEEGRGLFILTDLYGLPYLGWEYIGWEATWEGLRAGSIGLLESLGWRGRYLVTVTLIGKVPVCSIGPTGIVYTMGISKTLTT